MNIYFDENNNEIKLKPIYYSRRQLAEELDVPYSTVTYWEVRFKDFFEADMEERNKKFTARDLELFKLIKRLLKEEGFTVEQVIDHLKENNEKLYNNMKIDTTTNDLAINNILDDRIDKKLEVFRGDLVEEISAAVVSKVEELFKINYIATEKKLEDIKSEISVTICDEVDSKTSGIKEELKKEIEISTNKISDNISNEMRAILDDIESINQEIKESNSDVALKVKEMLEHRKQEQLELERKIAEENKSKSFLSRLFGR